jgi:hypothetical protein
MPARGEGVLRSEIAMRRPDPLLDNLRQILRYYRRGYNSEEEYAQAISSSAGENGLISRKKLRLLLGKDRKGINLKLVQLKDASHIPSKHKNTLLLADVATGAGHVLHVRIFDGDGKVIVETDETCLTKQARQVDELKKQLANLWALDKLRGNDKKRVMAAVESIVDYSHPKSPARDEIPLSLSEIRALHEFLVQKGRGGFGTLLGGRTLLGSVAARGKVMFILPSKAIESSTVPVTAVIYWDLHAMMEIIAALQRINPTIQIMIEVQEEGERPGEPGDRSSFFEKQPWYKHLTGVDAPSLICIGSPRANHASEILLTQMYGGEPFSESDGLGTPPPFRFYWRPESKLASNFAAREGDLGRVKWEVKDGTGWEELKGRDRLSALLVRMTGGDWKGLPLAYDQGTPEWETHGIVAAQRREGGQIWIVAAGLEGPASRGVSRQLSSLKPFPIDSPDPASKPVQYVMSFKVNNNPYMKSNNRDSRELGTYSRTEEIA